ncbi:MAG: hypothetical protein ACLPKW_07150, partial [Acetobacteraceae bacterium]
MAEGDLPPDDIHAPNPEPGAGPAPTESDVEPPKLNQLPALYTGYAQMRSSGYSWDQINGAMQQARDTALKEGYTGEQWDSALGLTPTPARTASEAPPAPRPIGLGSDLRAFADKYLNPSQPTPATAGDLLAQHGWNVSDAAKVFGHGVVNGLATAVDLINHPLPGSDYVKNGMATVLPVLDMLGEGLQGTG